MSTDPQSIAVQLNTLADQCVKCGLCLPHCPTYQASLSENESPRGRIALLQAVANRQLPPGKVLMQHLDRCLLCRNCERVCPSGVQYGRLFDLGQQLLWPAQPHRWPSRLGFYLLGHGKARRLSIGLVYLLQKTGLPTLLRGLLRRLLRQQTRVLPSLLRRGLLLPDLAWPAGFRSHYPAHGEALGTVALFTGCLAPSADRATLHDSIEVLRRLGYDVKVPPDQQCCGALHAHSGDQAGAARLAALNHRAFAAGYHAILFSASACGAHLREFAGGIGSTPIQDVVSFVANAAWPARLRLRPLDDTVLVQEPCSARNGLRNAQDIYRLLRRIPGLRVEPLAGNELCCGAAGSYLLRHPQLADQLLEHKLGGLPDPAQHLVTTNIGCALHLQMGLRAGGRAVTVLHPLSLLAQQIET